MARAKNRTPSGAKTQPNPARGRQRPSAERPAAGDHAAADLPKREVMTLLDPQLLGGALTSVPSPTQTTADGVQPAVQPTSDAAQTASQTTTDSTSLAGQYTDQAAKLNAGQPYQPDVTSVAQS
jgi:hypothetical protein